MATKAKNKSARLTSLSATLVKSLRGATAYKAKRKITVEDDKHVTDISRGEEFYLKHDKAKRAYILFDVDQDDNEIFKFLITKKVYDQLVKSHTLVGDVAKPAKPAAGGDKKPQGGSKDAPENLIATKAGQNKVLKNVRSIAKKAGFVGKVHIQQLREDIAFISLSPNANTEVAGTITLLTPEGYDGAPTKGNYSIGIEDVTTDQMYIEDKLIKGGFDAAVKAVVKHLKPYLKQAKPKKPKVQDFKAEFPYDTEARATALGLIFGGKAKPNGLNFQIESDHDIASVKRNAKKAGFKPLSASKTIVKLVHDDGTQMDVAVKDDYVAVRFN